MKRAHLFRIFVLVAVLILSMHLAVAESADENAVKNGGFVSSLSAWETSVIGGAQGDGHIIHDRRAYGRKAGSLRVETRPGTNISFTALADQGGKRIKAGSKLQLSLWWRKLVTADVEGAETKISVWLRHEQDDPLLLWSNDIVPPIAGTAMAGSVINFQPSYIIGKDSTYSLSIEAALRSGTRKKGIAVIQVDDLALEIIKEKESVAFKSKRQQDREVGPGDSAIESIAFSARSLPGKDVISSLVLKEDTGSPSILTGARLFLDAEPTGVLTADDRQLAIAEHQGHRLSFESLMLPLGKSELPLLVVADIAEKPKHGVAQTLSLFQFQGLYDEMRAVDSVTGPKIIVDAKPPGPPSGLMASGGRFPMLIWRNPSDADFSEVRLVRTENKPPSGPFDPQAKLLLTHEAAPSTLKTFVDRHARPGKFYYAVYAADKTGNWQTTFETGLNGLEVH